MFVYPAWQRSSDMVDQRLDRIGGRDRAAAVGMEWLVIPEEECIDWMRDSTFRFSSSQEVGHLPDS
jgi:hypothetical protein